MTIHLDEGKTYRLAYRDHQGHDREADGRVLRHYDASPAETMFPGRERPIVSVEFEVTPERIGGFGKPTVLNIAVADIVFAQEIT